MQNHIKRVTFLISHSASKSFEPALIKSMELWNRNVSCRRLVRREEMRSGAICRDRKDVVGVHHARLVTSGSEGKEPSMVMSDDR